jgi:hypothetical protein
MYGRIELRVFNGFMLEQGKVSGDELLVFHLAAAFQRLALPDFVAAIKRPVDFMKRVIFPSHDTCAAAGSLPF